jgi:hypothetical protein
MDLTRREFFEYTAGAAGLMGLAIPKPATDGPLTQQSRPWYTVYSDPNTYDSESMRGYWSALPEEWRIRPEPPTPLPLLIVPYCMWLFPNMADSLKSVLRETGTTVLMETGAGFANHTTFRQHRRWMRETFGIHIAAPTELRGKRTPAGAPYIEFTWPCRAMIRDFSRVVPPADRPEGDVIAWAGDLAVATRRRVGKGTLIYLGSPVGPALWAGDADARRWLYAVAHAA